MTEITEKELMQGYWRALLTGDMSHIPDSSHHFAIRERLMRFVYKMLPSDPHCLDCNAPLSGVGSRLLGMSGITRSNLSPNLCSRCDTWIRKEQLGTEVELAMLFADVRGSTMMAEQIGTSAFRQLIDRFYNATTEVLVESFALIDKLAGDEVVALYVPGIAGPDYPRRAVDAAQDLLRATGHHDKQGPWVPVGVGVHIGTAYVGAVGSGEGMADITALGDAVNVTARLASHAGPGEIVVSEEAMSASGLEAADFEQRELELKGKSASVTVRVIHVTPAYA